MRKSIKNVALCMAAALFLTACGNSQQSATTAAANSTDAVKTEAAQSDGAEESAEGGGNVLIAYFTAAENSVVDAVSSASVVTIDGEAKGCVQTVAEMIQETAGGELFSIQTSVDYPGDIGELIDYAAIEQDENERPELTTHIENLEDYDVIFVGYPNWWYDMPMVMYSFFEEYDFSGKTIIPFNVHNGSRFSSTISTIQELEPEATVIEDGFTVSINNVTAAEESVKEWVDALNY